jgi:hypothetical protein
MKHKFLSSVVSLVLLAAAIAGCSQIISGHHAPQTTQVPQATVAEAAPVAAVLPQGSAGMTVHKDPVTGRFVPVPEGPKDPLSKELSDAMSMSQEGLVEVPSPGGGFKVDLRGRFQQAMTATANTDGSVTVRCGQHQRREKE